MAVQEGGIFADKSALSVKKGTHKGVKMIPKVTWCENIAAWCGTVSWWV